MKFTFSILIIWIYFSGIRVVVGCEYTDIDDVEDAHDVMNQMTNLEKKVYL